SASFAPRPTGDDQACAKEGADRRRNCVIVFHAQPEKDDNADEQRRQPKPPRLEGGDGDHWIQKGKDILQARWRHILALRGRECPCLLTDFIRCVWAAYFARILSQNLQTLPVAMHPVE
ncbi:MAG: hypothetical protein UZ15_CFX003001753, partial [Chloroflexi bacterium OLB15]